MILGFNNLLKTITLAVNIQSVYTAYVPFRRGGGGSSGARPLTK